jgi:hypothetical protein
MKLLPLLVRPLRRASLLTVALLAAACEPLSPASPHAASSPILAKAYAAAFEAEAKDSTSAEPYLALLDEAVAQPDAPDALAASVAAIDALVMSTAGGLDAGPTAIAYRSRELLPLVAARLMRAWDAAEPAHAEHAGVRSKTLPLIRGLIATALHNLALYTGETRAAATWGSRRGCAQTATVVGPLDWTPLVGLGAQVPLGPDRPIEKAYRGVAPFAAAIAPVVVHADACLIDANASSFLQGMRAVVVDLFVSRAQTIHLSLTSTSAAVVDVGGVPAIRRGYEAGGRPTTQLASVDVPVGTVRVVIKVAQKGDGNLIELDAWGDDGLPIRTHAPRVGEIARVHAGVATAVNLRPPASRLSAEELMLTAAGLLGLGDARAAEHLLEQLRPSGSTAPGLDLLEARAVEAAEDLPDAKMFERIRSAIDRTLMSLPTAWEAIIAHARVTERRRGAGDGATDALRELGFGPFGARPAIARGMAKPPRDRMTVAYAALLAKRAQLLDVAETGFYELAKQAPGAPLLAALDARLHSRLGAEAIAAACHGGLSRAETDCFEAHRDQGSWALALAEIERLRKLRGAPEGLRDLEITTRILAGDLEGALAVYNAMHPVERRLLDAPGYAAGRGDLRTTRALLRRDRVTARDAPYAIHPLVRLLGLEIDPVPALEKEGKRLVAADKAAAFLPGAATAILRRTERYELLDSGLLHYVTYDIRRVSGTTDVATGGVSYGPTIEGRGSPRLLRRRIHKRDGRILEPDAAANAAQQSDLSQLEQGDYVEQIVEGWVLPGDTGQIVVDTPDLLPERTSVREATVEVRRPASIPLSIWAHALLGKPDERTEGSYKVSVWHLKDRPPRRIEDGVPKMDRSVSVSLGTQTWANVARAIDENIRSLDERDPFVARWANEAAGADRTPSLGLVERVVAAAGKKIKVASPGELSDVAAVFSVGAQRLTARTILELGQGSRAWVIYRALRELGVKVDLAIAETEPFSASVDFPPHVGRFRHPLVIASLPARNGKPGGNVWIDADIEGPPLPPGRISPELRGRTALLASGAMVTVLGTSGESGDEVDIRLTVDAKGDAKGTFTILLHGRTAQSLAEAFETVVGTDRREMLRSVVLGWVPWADVEDVSVSSMEGSWEIALRAAIAVHGYGRPEGKDGKTWVLSGLEPVHFVYPRSIVGTLGATYASRGARQNALSINAPLQYHVHRRTELPPGTTVVRVPEGVNVDGKSLQASRKTTVSGQVIEDDFTLSLPTGTIAADSYQAFVDKVQAVDAGFMGGTRVNVSVGRASAAPSSKIPSKVRP